MTFDKASFEAGYLIAVANIMHLHGDEVIAEDVLREGDIRANAVRRLDVNDFDARPLRKLFREMKRKAAYDALRHV
ncbi:hypothetical protein [Novosphingobium sp. BL-52-GroH]|uniref:hypothetical protein n=1 Tax=Novosphingobium sp. BL-52-GroH TaxID=3349877 RepID=UPI00384FE924